ncbi:methyltransferase-like protein 24 isoform X1 [Fundulus heteroclitus]|uniref:methyltransferase-like protein 24 isoform X1 n=1 Tax=Fundulus heteroclitus TaxID=8078 RepID=UPI00165B4F0B|nr:methyltransferase-like protein 24 isoform X1 [Fundulus heteroclitus]XP_036003290.1 methyltransferase-like protein 24 isoform X1 [Fundulus heteroclitus]
MDMRGEKVNVGLLLRLAALLVAVCWCLHVVYLETSWQSSPPPLTLGRPTQPGLHWGQQTGMKHGSAEMQGKNSESGTSYHHPVRSDGRIRKKHVEKENPHRLPACCPPLHPHRKALRWHINLQPWASETHSLEDEAKRFLGYITTPQVTCASLVDNEAATEPSAGHWAVCLDPKFSLTHRMKSKRCRVYSFGLGMDDRSMDHILARSGCEVHCFDPSLEEPHLQKAEMWFHRISVDWRDPSPALIPKRQANHKKLATILDDFGHRDVDVLKADMESAEWKILENLVLEGVLDSVGQLLLELHLHWAGFEVAGDDPSVVRYWFSLLKELERAGFRLFYVHSDPNKPHLFLHKDMMNASSAYTLSWVNTRWRPSWAAERQRK